MSSLWNWLVSYTNGIGLIGSIVTLVAFITGIITGTIKIYISRHRQQQNKRLADERSKLEIKAYRREFCVALLSAIHELAPEVAEWRKVHDDLRARAIYFLPAHSNRKRMERRIEAAHEKFARAGSELSIDPAGQKVKDALIAYLNAQNDYVQAICKPMSTFPDRHFKKTDTATLDGLAEKANDKLTALEEAIRIFLDSS
jgi:hypothetical protein